MLSANHPTVVSSAAALDRAFASLADPTRREIVSRLAASGEVSVGDLARPFRMSLPAVIKHIDVLADAGLLVRRRCGRQVQCSLVPAAMTQAQRWLDRNLAFWSSRLDALGELVDGKS